MAKSVRLMPYLTVESTWRADSVRSKMNSGGEEDSLVGPAGEGRKKGRGPSPLKCYWKALRGSFAGEGQGTKNRPSPEGRDFVPQEAAGGTGFAPPAAGHIPGGP